MPTDRDIFKKGRLLARPNERFTDLEAPTGFYTLDLDTNRDALLYVPPGYKAGQPTALAVMLHGAGGNADHGLSLIKHLADQRNIILLAPSSRNSSWDIINLDQYGPDVIFINQALELTFSKYAIDPKHLAIGGFSDGASYALSIGLTNGDLFTHIIAFSPGFAYTPQPVGKPLIYISHGVHDDILPINVCSRRLAPKLQAQGYNLTYKEFEGVHTIPNYISNEAVDWFLNS